MFSVIINHSISIAIRQCKPLNKYQIYGINSLSPIVTLVIAVMLDRSYV